eukprot:RCo028391
MQLPQKSKLPCRVLSPEEMRKLGERLSKSPTRTRPEVFAEPKKTTAAELAKFYERNYDRPVARSRKMREEDEAFLEEAVARVTVISKGKGVGLEPTDPKLVETVSRLYKRSMQQREAKAALLEQKFAAPLPSSKKLSPRTREEALDRLYTKSAAHRKQVLEVAEKRVYGVPAPPKMLTAEELHQHAEKMCNLSMENRQARLAKIEEAYVPTPTRKVVSPQVRDAVFARLAAATK